MLDNALAVVNSKGGVGKTSIVANVAASAALDGWRVLAVDLDAQGNLARDLGYRERSTQGRALLEAVMSGGPPTPLPDVRGGLHVIDGGRHTKQLADLLVTQALRHSQDTYDLEDALRPLADTYDLVLLDCPPAGGQLGRWALAMACYAVIPTRADDASIDGLEGLAEEITQVVTSGANPDLDVLGVALFDVGAGDTRLERETRGELADLLDGIAPVLEATVRHSRRSARDMRRRGEVAAEYEQAALAASPWYASNDGETRERFSTAATGLAGDYQRLTSEILHAVATRAHSATAGR